MRYRSDADAKRQHLYVNVHYMWAFLVIQDMTVTFENTLFVVSLMKLVSSRPRDSSKTFLLCKLRLASRPKSRSLKK